MRNIDRLQNRLKCLVEELKDISDDEKNYHYTNLEALKDIVQTKGLKSEYYMVKSDKADAKNMKHEIATVRDAGKHAAENPAQRISGGIDNIKFTLFTKRILAGVRGVRKGPIAEYPKEHMQSFKTCLNEIKQREKFFDAPLPFVKTHKKMEFEEIVKWCKKHYILSDFDDDDLYRNTATFEDLIKNIAVTINILQATFFSYLNLLSNREVEERFMSKKKFQIPLNPLYMKVEFTRPTAKRYLEYIAYNDNNMDKEDRIQYCEDCMEALVKLRVNNILSLEGKSGEYYRDTMDRLKKAIENIENGVED